MGKFSGYFQSVFDQSELPNNYQEFDAPYEPPAPTPAAPAPESRSVLKDAAGLWGTGVGSLVKGAGWLFNSEELTQLGQDTADYWQNTLSQTQLEANQKPFWTEDGFGEGITDLNTIFGTVVQSLPHMVPGMSAAALAGRGALALGLSRKAASMSAMTAGTMGEGVTIGAVVGQEVDEAIREMSEDDKLQSPYYADLRKLYDEDEATRRLSQMASNPAALQAGTVGAALGIAFNKFLGDALTRRLSGGPLKEGAKGTLLEAGTELFQSGTEAYSRQEALEKYAAVPMNYTEIVNEMIGGLAAGGAMGATVGTLGGLQGRGEDDDTVIAPPAPSQTTDPTDRVIEARRAAESAGADPLAATVAGAQALVDELSRGVPELAFDQTEDVGGLLSQAMQAEAAPVEPGRTAPVSPQLAPVEPGSARARPDAPKAAPAQTETPTTPLSERVGRDRPRGEPEIVYQQDGVTVRKFGDRLGYEAKSEAFEGASWGRTPEEARRALTQAMERNQPAEAVLQNRDRSRPAYVEQMQAIASEPDYDRVSVSRDPNTGAPMVFDRRLEQGPPEADAPVIWDADKGDTDTVTMSDGKGGTRKVPVQYAVVEADAITASHNADGSANTNYGRRGLTALNNGRTAGLQEAFRKGTAQPYVEALLGDSAHGISPEAIRAKEKPMLVRLFDESALEGIADPGASSNVAAGAELSAVEQAQTDARKLDADLLDEIRPGEVTGTANIDFVRRFTELLGKDGAGNALRDAKGLLTAAGQKRIKGALVERAYRDATITQELTEAVDNDLKTLGDALAEVAGRWALMRERAKEGSINPDMDVTESLVSAVNMIRTSRQQGTALADLAGQVDAFSGPVDQMAVEILHLFYHGKNFGRIRAKDVITQTLLGYVDSAMASAPEPDMFGEMTTPQNALETQRGQIENRQDPRGLRPDGADDREVGPEGERPVSGTGGQTDAEQGQDTEAAQAVEGSTTSDGVSGLKSGRTHNNPSILQSLVDSVFADTNLFGDGSDSQPARVQRFDSLNRDIQHVVLSKMLGAINDNQVLQSVIESVPVDVMNVLVGPEWFAEMLLEDVSVLRERLSIPRDKAVPKSVVGFIDSLVLSIKNITADGGTEKSGLGLKPSLGDFSGDGALTSQADSVNNGHVKTSIAGQEIEVNTTPTEAQKEAGVYKKGHIKIHGLDISIENPKGSLRSGTDPDGDRWERELTHHYGYIKRTEGADGDQVDVFIGPNPDSQQVFVIDQTDAQGNFDEHKVMLGFPNQVAARRGYLANYEEGWTVGPIKQFTVDEFKAWLNESDTTQPINSTLKAAPAGTEPTDDFDLETQTEEQLAEQARTQQATQQEQARQQQEAEQRERADAERDDFVLSGSSRPVDQAEARGQGNMFDVMGRSEQTTSEQEPKSETQQIEDFGEKIEGARKDYASKMAAAKEKDVAAVPLSESWPEPDYQKLLDSGADPEAVGFAHALRDEVPPKPRKGWKLKGWARQVEAFRDVAEKTIRGDITMAMVRGKAGEQQFKAVDAYVVNRADLYAEVGHSKSLKGLRFFNGHFTIFEGKKGSFDKWIIDRVTGASNFGNMPRRFVTADTKEQAIKQFRKVYESLDAKGAEPKNTRFDIYTSRHDRNDVFIGKKIGKDVVRIKDGFDSVKEAREYLSAKRDVLERILAKMKQIPNHRKESNSPRVGKDHRNGGDVTPEAFAEAFGFRGVQFGNYVEQGRRQQDLNEAYDGLMDLAGILNIPAKALSLNGELGLAFGARGKGGKNAPKAHYESGNIVINLTKKSGAGSLAHEWWHSLDNYFARERGTSQHMGYATGGSAHMSVRPEVAEAFRNVKRTVNRIGLKQRSQKLDKVRTKAYWSTDVEMTARAFESYVIEKLKDQGNSNDYLANIVSEEYWKASEALGMEDSDSYPYPEAAEIPEIRVAYDNLFEVIEVVEQPDGSVMLREPDGMPYYEFGISDANDIQARRSSYRANPDQAELFSPEELDALEKVDPYDNLESRPGTTEAQRREGRSALRDLFRQLNARFRRERLMDEEGGGVSLLGAAIYKNFKEGKPNQLIGQTVRTPQDLAALAQVYRDPRFETFRFVLTKDGEVVGEQAITSRLPSMVKFDENVIPELKQAMKAYGADGYYMMHNHPSGKSNPSSADLSTTRRVASEIPGFQAHVVIDFNEYSVIGASGVAEVIQDDTLGSEDFWASPEQPHDLLGFKIGDPKHLAELAKKLQEPGRVVFIGANNKGQVTLLTSMPPTLMTNLSVIDELRVQGMATLRRLKRTSGSGGYGFLVVNNERDVHRFSHLIQRGVVRDVISPNGTSAAALHLARYPGDAVEFGGTRAMRVGDEVDAFNANDATVARLRAQVNDLIPRVDAAYEAGNLDQAEDLDAELDELFQQLDARLSELEEDGPTIDINSVTQGQKNNQVPPQLPNTGDLTDTETGLQEDLAERWASYLESHQSRRAAVDLEDVIRSARTDIEDYGTSTKRFSDDQILDALVDAYENHSKNRASKRKPKGTFKRQINRPEDVRFSRAGEASEGLTATEARTLANRYMRNWKGRPSVKVVDSIQQMPKGLREAIRKAQAESDMRAVFWQDAIHILAPRIPNEQALQEVILHEVVGHYGLRGMLNTQLKPVLNEVYVKFAQTDRAKEIIQNYFPKKDFDPKNANHRLMVAEELLAHLAESGQHQHRKLWQRIVTAIRDGLRRLGFTIRMTENDLLKILEGAQRTVEQGGFSRSSDADMNFSRAGQTSTPEFRAWFGDSKVADANGEPLVVYHGTGTRFDTFDESRLGSFTGADSAAEGFFFTDSWGLAEQFRDNAQRARMPLADIRDAVEGLDDARFEFLADDLGMVEDFHTDGREFVTNQIIERLDEDRSAFFDDRSNFDQTLKQYIDPDLFSTGEVKSVYLAISNPREVTVDPDTTFDDGLITREVRAAKKAGSDGLIIRGMLDTAAMDDKGNNQIASDVYVAFRPEQIKSATDNAGTFDPANPDIRFSRTGTRAIDEFTDLNEAQRQAFGKISPLTPTESAREWFAERTSRWQTKLRQGIVDRYAALMDVDEAVHGKDVIENSTASSSWVLAQMAGAASGALQTMLTDARIYLDPREKVIKLREGSDRGLNDVLKQLGSPGEIDRFFGWIAGNRSRKLLEEGRENLFTPEEVEALATANTGTTKNGDNRAELYDRVFAEFQQYRDDILEIADTAGLLRKGMEEEQAMLYLAEKYEIAPALVERYKKAMRAVDRADDEDVRDMAQARAGEIWGTLAEEIEMGIENFDQEYEILTTDQRDLWANEFYVPFYREAEHEGQRTGPVASSGLSRQKAYERLKGGTGNLRDLLENTMMNFHHLLQASLKNQAAMQALENSEAMGIAHSTTESRRDTENSTFVLRNGMKHWYNVDDPLVFKAVTALAHPGMNSSAMKVMRGFKRLFTNLTTTTPQFVIANLLRDSMQASATSEVSKNMFRNMAQGTKAYGNNRIRAAMMASGGAFSFGHLYGENAEEVRLQLTGGLARADILRSPSMIPAALGAVWRHWNEVTNFTENINRAAIYEQNRAEKGDLYAAFKARDLMNFSQHGAWPAMRILIDVVPFLNARLQGLDKIYRSGVKPGIRMAMGQGGATDKQAMARFWSVTGALALATVALFLKNRDDEEYQKLEEWQKDTYWFIRTGKDSAIFIPKPFEVGAIATLVERLTEQAVSDTATGKLFAERLQHMLMDTFSFSPVPQMFQPGLDVYANYDAFTDRPIESMGMERLSPSLRTRGNTTAIAKGLSKASEAVGGADGKLTLSPVQIDHMIQGYFGAVGGWIAGIGDTIWRTANGEVAPSKHWYEYQPVKRFYKNLGDEDKYTRYGTVFYEALKETNRVYADIREYQALGDTETALRVLEENRQMLAMRKSLNRVQRQLGKINQAMERVYRMPGDSEYKRRELDRLRAIRNRIQTTVGQKLEQLRASSS